jgi:ABC-type dipeptide/oligopeptide/nickel transport system ATPase component
MEESKDQNKREERLRQVTTYAFVGAAGTGKSQRAQSVASIVDADYIIDDGLVI